MDSLTHSGTPADLQDREDRLTALLQLLGFPTLDHLEDYVVLNPGGVKLVPAAPPPRQDGSLPLDETQQPQSLLPSAGSSLAAELAQAHARRESERRVENRQLKDENRRVRQEVEWARKERQQQQDRADDLARDKTRLLDRVEELRRENEALKAGGRAATPTTGTTSADGSSSLTENDDGPSHRSQLARCYDDIADLEQTVAELEEQLQAAHRRSDELALQVSERGEHVHALEEELAALKKEKREVERARDAYKKRWDKVVSSFAESQSQPSPRPSQEEQKEQPATTSGTVAAMEKTSPRRSSSVAAPGPSQPSSSRPLASQLRGPAAPLQPSPRTNRISRASSATASPAAAASVVQHRPTSASSDASREPTPSPAPGFASTAAAAGAPPSFPSTASAVPPPRLTAIPAYLQPAASATTSAAPASPARTQAQAGSSTPRLQPAASATTSAAPSPSAALPPSQHSRQLKLFPPLVKSYLTLRDATLTKRSRFYNGLELVATFDDPAVRARIEQRADACTAGRRPTLPAAEEFDARFPPSRPSFSADVAALARAGELVNEYATVEKLEADVEAVGIEWELWTGGAVAAVQRERERGEKKKVGKGAVSAKRVIGEGAERPTTPAGQSGPVRKRRKVVKSSTPAVVDPASQTTAGAVPLPAAAVAALVSASPGAGGAGAGSSTVKRSNKRWNLVSPTKRNAASPSLRRTTAVGAGGAGGSPTKAGARSPHRSPGKSRLNLNLNAAVASSSPRKSAADNSAVLVDDDQLGPLNPLPAVLAAAPAPPPPQSVFLRSSSKHSHPTSESTSYEPEPDTLVTEPGAGHASQQELVSDATDATVKAPTSPAVAERPPKPRRTSSVSVAPRTRVEAGEDDPFVARPGEGVGPMSPSSPFILRPSPNGRGRAPIRTKSKTAARDPSPSPSSSPSASPSPSKGMAFEMPPSAQPVRRLPSRVVEAEDAEEEGEEEDEPTPARAELRFFGGLGTPPVRSPSPKKRKGKKRKREEGEEGEEEEEEERVKQESLVVVVKQEEEDEVNQEEENDEESTSPPRHRRSQRHLPAGSSTSKPLLSKKPRKSRPLAPSASTLFSLQFAARAFGFTRTTEALTASDNDSGDEDAVGVVWPRYPNETTDEEVKRRWTRKHKAARKLSDGRKRALEEAAAEKAANTSTSTASTSKRAVELNPDRNQGEAHAFKQVVRKKGDRAKMLAEACEGCSAYYARSGKSAPLGACHHVRQGGGGAGVSGMALRSLDLRAQAEDERLAKLGRHRVQQRTEPDPVDFWQLGMPSTQQVEETNQKARAQNAEREAYREQEASKQNGLYRFRD